MPKGLLLILLICAVSLFGACRKHQEADKPALLKVAGRSISLEEFKRDFALIIPDDQALSAEEIAELKRSFLRQIIDRELTLAEADRLGVDVTPEELEKRVDDYRKDYPAGEFERMLGEQGLSLEQWRDDLRDRMLMEKVIDKQVYRRLKVGDEEVEAYYEANRAEFDRPEQVRARQIVVATEAEGQRVLGLLCQGEDFSSVARDNSLSPDGEQGGDLGFFGRGEMPPEFDEVVFSLPAGRLSDLVKTDYGYHIFRVEEKRKAQRLSLDLVRGDIRAKLRGEKEEQAYQSWLLGLGGRAVIEVDWSLLDESGEKARPK